MSHSQSKLISVVVPVFNEAKGLPTFHAHLLEILKGLANHDYEILYCNDGSTDNTAELVHDFTKTNKHVKLLSLSRNFGKENALAAGIASALGDAIIMLDGDGQHPVELIPDFITSWEAGAKVVIGVSTYYHREGWFKRLGSRLFYALFNRLAAQKTVPGASDFQLIDRQVQQVFIGLNETNRVTRRLLDWIGFERAYVPFVTKSRASGNAGYSNSKLLGLAASSFVSMTPTPLYIFGYTGVGITLLSFMLGVTVFIEQLVLKDPLSWGFTGTAMLGILLLFMIGIVLMSQGILSLYISHINNQSKQRPLYVIDYSNSSGISNSEPHA